MSRQNTLSEEEIIGQAAKAFGGLIFGRSPNHRLLDACEAFYMNGSHDAQTGDVDAPMGHVYRVHRWLVITDDHGFHYVETYDNEDEAMRNFDIIECEYVQWAGDDE